jgi:hypothetical protein
MYERRSDVELRKMGLLGREGESSCERILNVGVRTEDAA